MCHVSRDGERNAIVLLFKNFDGIEDLINSWEEGQYLLIMIYLVRKFNYFFNESALSNRVIGDSEPRRNIRLKNVDFKSWVTHYLSNILINGCWTKN